MRSITFILISKGRAEYYDKIFSGINPNPYLSEIDQHENEFDNKPPPKIEMSDSLFEEEKWRERKNVFNKFHHKINIHSEKKLNIKWRDFMDFILYFFDMQER
ncbi:MAG: hypothetical protein LBH92_04970 [Bacteroidales bacterium]|jgi:hypothetical protein|nr:hypothetical protein [Bacteroidales bacterium]